MRVKKLYLELYKIRFILIESNDSKEVEEKYNLELGEDLYAHTALRSIKEKELDWSCIYLVFNTKHTHAKITPGCVAHESIHAANYIFSIIGAEVDIYNDETYCYLVEWIVNQVDKFLNTIN